MESPILYFEEIEANCGFDRKFAEGGGWLKAKVGSSLMLRRSKIRGGWLVLYENSITFVPDPDHKWDGNSLP